MADNRLERGHSTASFAHGAAFLKDSGNGQQLSTVANRCARAMPLDEIKGTRFNAGLRVCPAQSQSLSFHAWGGNAAFPVRRHAPSIQDSIDLVAVTLGVGQALQAYEATAFTRDKAVAALVIDSHIGGSKRTG